MVGHYLTFCDLLVIWHGKCPCTIKWSFSTSAPSWMLFYPSRYLGLGHISIDCWVVISSAVITPRWGSNYVSSVFWKKWYQIQWKFRNNPRLYAIIQKGWQTQSFLTVKCKQRTAWITLTRVCAANVIAQVLSFFFSLELKRTKSYLILFSAHASLSKNLVKKSISSILMGGYAWHIPPQSRNHSGNFFNSALFEFL